MIEHKEWKGSFYPAGIEGQKIFIAGYSHHSNEPDDEWLTHKVMQNYVLSEGSDRISFFDRIATYFGDEQPQLFWQRVLFFNFVPDSIGVDSERYNKATGDQEKRGRDRVLKLLKLHRPDKMFVFSRKGWSCFPGTLEEERGYQCNPMQFGRYTFTWGTYDSEGHQTTAVGLQHPQYAPTAVMRDAVRFGLALNAN